MGNVDVEGVFLSMLFVASADRLDRRRIRTTVRLSLSLIDYFSLTDFAGSYQKGLEGGWIPSDPDDRLYPNICS